MAAMIIGTFVALSVFCAVIIISSLAISNMRLNAKLDGFREATHGGRSMFGGRANQQLSDGTNSSASIFGIGGLVAMILIVGGLLLQSL